MKTSIKITPAYLRIGLFASMGLLFIIGVVGFYFFRTSLEQFAVQVNSDTASASTGDQDVAKLQQLKKELADNQVGVARAKSIVAESKEYQYQNQIIDDITSYASRAGFSIKGFTFTDTAAQTAGPTPGAVAATPEQPVPAGLKTTLASITISNDLTYLELMNFLKSIEDNLTKMEINGVSISVNPITGLIVPGTLTIGVYIK